MGEQDGSLEGWSDAVSEASRHVQERLVAEEEAAERARPKPNAASVVVALVVLVAVLVGDAWVLTRTPNPPSPREQEIDLRWLVARGEHFSLMVLDLDMPMLGGREVLAAVRRSLATAGLPVIVLTGSSDPDSEIEMMQQGADDYVRKPFEPRRFIARVGAALRRAGA